MYIDLHFDTAIVSLMQVIRFYSVRNFNLNDDERSFFLFLLFSLNLNFRIENFKKKKNSMTSALSLLFGFFYSLKKKKKFMNCFEHVDQYIDF